MLHAVTFRLLLLQSSHELHQITIAKRFSGCFWNRRTGAHMKRWNADRSANEIGSNRAAPKLSLRLATVFFHFMEKSLVNELQRRLSGLFHKHSIRRHWLLPFSRNFVSDELSRSLNSLREREIPVNIVRWSTLRKNQKEKISMRIKNVFNVRSAYISYQIMETIGRRLNIKRLLLWEIRPAKSTVFRICKDTLLKYLNITNGINLQCYRK